MKFRVTARDNRARGWWRRLGRYQPASGQHRLGRSRSSGPNTAVTWSGGSTQAVTWNVAGTTGNGINTTNVRILLSTDGGLTYPTVLLSQHSEQRFRLGRPPRTSARTSARIRVEAVGNIFFDISNANFTITPAAVVGHS